VAISGVTGILVHRGDHPAIERSIGQRARELAPIAVIAP